MGSFAATLFNFMLGWLQNVVSGLWDLTKSQQTRDMLVWLGEHWLTLVLLLAIAGLIVDYVVWFIRWRPYYVWGSWLRRLFGRKQDKQAVMEAAAEYPAYEPQQVAYPIPQTETWQEETQTYEQQAVPVYEQTYEQEAAYGQPVDPSAYQRPVAPLEGYTMPYTHSQEPAAAYIPADDTWQPEPEQLDEGSRADEPVHPGLSPSVLEENLGWTAAPAPRQRRSQRNLRSQRTSQQSLNWVRSGISQVAQKIDFLGKDQDETQEYAYMPPPPAVDKREAFHAPVYPDRWPGETDNQGGNDT